VGVVRLARTPRREEFPCAPSWSPIHLGRLGTPAEIGELVAFLAMERSRFVARQAINFTGGWP
jgi:NAD(P)-dependent dehydrogenase (short-subunit alcohol dehydrogenase family)